MTAVQVILILIGSLMAAYLARYIFTRIIHSLSKKTESDVDDKLAEVLRRPVMISFILVGFAMAVVELDLKSSVQFIAFGVLKSAAVLIWGIAAMRVGDILLDAVSRQADKYTWIQPKTVPLFEMLAKIIVVGGALYFALVAWDVNVTSWIASAGILGIALGFAAKDTLANLFSGVFIIADAPYKIGDFIVLDSGIRGLVTDIGIRSTRILTRDDIEVILPNAVIANSSIVNETGGPHQKMRVRVKVSVAYGTDVDQVEEILMSCAKDVEHLTDNPAPRVRFREFGGSGLVFEFLAWINEPVFRGRVLHNLNKKVYNAFREAGIEIPYSKHDVYIKERPALNRDAA